MELQDLYKKKGKAGMKKINRNGRYIHVRGLKILFVAAHWKKIANFLKLIFNFTNESVFSASYIYFFL